MTVLHWLVGVAIRRAEHMLVILGTYDTSVCSREISPIFVHGRRRGYVYLLAMFRQSTNQNRFFIYLLAMFRQSINQNRLLKLRWWCIWLSRSKLLFFLIQYQVYVYSCRSGSRWNAARLRTDHLYFTTFYARVAVMRAWNGGQQQSEYSAIHGTSIALVLLLLLL